MIRPLLLCFCLYVITPRAVLVAIAIPVFTSQLEKSREATDLANVRSAYATLVVQFLDTGSGSGVSVPVQQRVANWATYSNEANASLKMFTDSGLEDLTVPAATTGSYNVVVDDSGSVKVTAG